MPSFFCKFCVCFKLKWQTVMVMKYFGTDGIRGKALEEITLELAYRVGASLSEFKIPIVVGIDTRASSMPLAQALISGYKNDNYQFAGVISTPALMYYSMLKKCLGVMITASHNLATDNGIKIFINGVKISNDLALLIEDKMDKCAYIQDEEKPKLEINEEILNLYYQFLDSIFIKPPFKVVFDAANGSTSEILRHYFPDDDLINYKPDGCNINLNAGSTSPYSLVNKVKTSNAKVGFAFDGDGDRLLAVSQNGNIYEGDMLLYFFAINLQKEKELILDTVVTTEIINPGVIEGLMDKKINIITTDVGDRNIYYALNSGYSLGGESSGHIINKKYLPFGDGILNAFLIINILLTKSEKLENYFKGVNLYHKSEFKIPIEKFNDKIKNKINTLKSRTEAKLILRKSGTEKIMRLYIYHRNRLVLEHIVRKIKKVLK